MFQDSLVRREVVEAQARRDPPENRRRFQAPPGPLVKFQVQPEALVAQELLV